MVWGASEVTEVLDWLASWNQGDDPAAVAVGLVQLRSQYLAIVHHDGKEANELKDCGGVVAGDRQSLAVGYGVAVESLLERILS